MAKSFLVGLSGKVAIFRPLLLIALLCVGYESAEGVLVQTPTNTTVIANHSTFLNCSKLNNKSDELTWHHYTVAGKAKGVYEAGSIRGTYRGRFDIEKNLTSGAFNLLVQRAEPTDAGRYECVEDPLKKDTGASAELTVMDSNLVCESDKDLNEIVGPTECAKSITPDQLQLSCSVTYSGNFPPQMEWIKVGSELLSNETKCDVSGNRVMCNATLKANHNMDESVYMCQIITAEQYNCSLKVNKTIYTFADTSVRAVTTTEEVFCSANTSVDLSCLYKWYKDNKTEQLGQTLKPSNPGIYRCQAECTIRNETCEFTAMVINASEPETSNAALIAGLLVGSIIVGIITTIAIIMIWRRYKKEKKKNQHRGVELTTSGLLQERTETDGKNENAPLQNMMNTIGCCFRCQDSDDSDYDIEKNFSKAEYIDKGFGGDIHGPVQYKGRQCAIEKIKFSMANLTEEEKEEVLAELENIRSKCQEWKAIHHENLISIYEVKSFSKVHLKSVDVFIIMEYAGGGSVRKALQRRGAEDLPMEVVKNWATQIAQGMEYLHKKGIVHKNLNSAQILIMESLAARDILNKTLKISQFRLNSETHLSTQINENSAFAAPEVSEENNVKEDDVWSFGIVIWEMLTRRIPYKEEKAPDRIRDDVRQGAKALMIPDSCPNALKQILEGCRSLDRSERPTFSNITESLQAWQLVNSPA